MELSTGYSGFAIFGDDGVEDGVKLGVAVLEDPCGMI